MTITVDTASLIGLLADALQMSDQKSKMPLGIHFGTHRGAYGAEPGTVDLLAATATDRYVVGHGFIPVDGQIEASVWPLDAVRTVMAICKGFNDSRGKDHTVDVELSSRKDDDGAEYFLVTLRESMALFEADTEFQFRADTEQHFPLKGVWRALTGQPTGKKYSVSNEVGWAPRVVVAVSNVAKRQKESMWWYRTPGSATWRVQIGPSWVGAINPVAAAPGMARNEPGIDPLIEPQDGWADIPVVDAEVVDETPSGDVIQFPLAIEAPTAELPIGESDYEPPDDEDDIVDAEVVEDEAEGNDDPTVGPHDDTSEGEADESAWDAEVDDDVDDAADDGTGE